MPVHVTIWTLVAGVIAGGVLSILLGRKIAGVSGRTSSSWVAEVVASMIACGALIIGTGFLVGNSRDLPTVLVNDQVWKSALRFIWYHPPIEVLAGSVIGVLVLSGLRALGRNFGTQELPS